MKFPADKTFLQLLAAAALVSGAMAAYPANTDVPGGKDSPLVSRYAGSHIVGYAHARYGELTLPLGKEKDAGSFEKSAQLEGKLTRIIYVDPPGRSPLEVFGNYRIALRKAGFKTLYSCSGDGCGSVFHMALYPRSRELHDSQVGEFAFAGVEDQHYLSAELDDANGTAWVSLYVARDTNDAGVYAGPDRVMTLLQVVQGQAMPKNTVTANAAAPDGMAKRLGSQPDFDAYVVGHIDDRGALAYNMDLSLRRVELVAR